MYRSGEKIESVEGGERLRVCSLGETCGFVKLIQKNASRYRSSLDED